MVSLMTSLTYMLKDNKFKEKFLTLFLLTFLCVLPNILTPGEAETSASWIALPLGAFAIAIQVFYYGYLSAGIKAISEQESNYILPIFNPQTHTTLGFKFFVAVLLFSIPMIIVFLLLGYFIGKLAILLALIFFILFSPAFFKKFALAQNIFAFFKFKEIFKSIFDNKKLYFKHLGFIYLIGLIMCIFCVILSSLSLLPGLSNSFIFNLITGLIISAIGAYTNMCLIYLIAKCTGEK